MPSVPWATEHGQHRQKVTLEGFFLSCHMLLSSAAGKGRDVLGEPSASSMGWRTEKAWGLYHHCCLCLWKETTAPLIAHKHIGDGKDGTQDTQN